MSAFFLFTLAAAVSALVIPLAWRLAPHFGLLDIPDARKVHSTPVPRVGGWGITIGSLVPIVLLFDFDPLLQSFVFGSLVLFAFGLWDDARQIDHWAKFTGQILAAGIAVYYGDLYVSRVPFVDALALSPEIMKPLTVVALVGVINAINHSDGLDGLAGGESMFSLIALAFLGYLADSALVTGIALATIGGTFGFLRHNTHPAKVFMGDAGSQVLGFTLGFLAIYLTQVASPAISAALPLLILGLPLADILAVLFQRIRGRMNWFKATRNHVHHRLLDLGFTHFETVVIIYSIQAGLVICAVLLRYHSDLALTLIYLVTVGGLFGALLVAERRHWKVQQYGGKGLLGLPGSLGHLAENKVLRSTLLIFISIIVPAFMLLCAFWVESVPRDFGAVAGVMAVAIAVQLARGQAADSLLVRASIYVAATFSAYLFVRYPGADSALVAQWTNTGIIGLAVAIGLFLRIVSERKFALTPTDYLIVFVLVALTVFDSIDVRTSVLVQFATYAIVLFYGCELILERIAVSRHAFHWSALGALSIMALRGALGGL